MKLRIISAIAAVLSLGIASTAQARLMKVVPYQSLFDTCDLIVIANPVTKTTDTQERTYFESINMTDKSGMQSKVAAIGVETEFEVSTVIKGNRTTKQFVLHHFREVPDNSYNVIIGGPNTVFFDPTDRRKVSRDVLLFLTKEKDGRFAPCDGQTDPGFRSVQELR